MIQPTHPGGRLKRTKANESLFRLQDEECTLFDFNVNNIDIGRYVNLENDQIRRAEDAGAMYLESRVECLMLMLDCYAFGDNPIREGRLCKA